MAGDFGVNGLSDADNDGDSDGADFLAWQQQLGSVPAVPAAAAIPEPTAYCLFTICWSAICVRRRRQSELSRGP
ncbi:MAG: hypothetical protein H0T51_03655 [Pirellulales bacterium]|nr:hypothetical protein [Pirellulales bacterium]